MSIGEKFKKFNTGFNMKSNIKKTWGEMDPDKKKKLVILIVIGGMLLLTLITYKVRTHNGPPVTKKQEIKKKDISLEPRLLEKSQ